MHNEDMINQSVMRMHFTCMRAYRCMYVRVYMMLDDQHCVRKCLPLYWSARLNRTNCTKYINCNSRTFPEIPGKRQVDKSNRSADLMSSAAKILERISDRQRGNHVSPSSQVPCARDTGVRCTLTMLEHHDVCELMMIEGGPRLIPELDRRRVYHRDAGSSSLPSPSRRRPRFRAAPISARQHLIHTAPSAIHSSSLADLVG